MVKQLTRLKRLTGQQQATYYYARKRRKGLVDPSSVLFRTHTFNMGDEINIVDTFGDNTNRPVTFSFSLSRSDSAEGVLFEFGSEDRGIAVWSDGSDLGVGAGASGDDGVTLEVEDALLTEDQSYKFVLSVIPGSGIVRLYRDGHLVSSGQAVNGSFDGAWADTNDGGVGDVSGTVSSRVPEGMRIALANVALIGALSVYVGQAV